jgi:hypothetical protein
MKDLYVSVVVLTAAAHFVFIGYIVVGGFLALRWPKTIWLHVPVAIWGIAIEMLDFTCPLTWLERWAQPKPEWLRWRRTGSSTTTSPGCGTRLTPPPWWLSSSFRQSACPGSCSPW